ncbi:COP9 signalosome (CSN) subunit [Actinomortierella ambigua]|nr:COP9 signalosome (CSN) subunit [Actinomortierella ambigua]
MHRQLSIDLTNLLEKLRDAISDEHGYAVALLLDITHPKTLPREINNSPSWEDQVDYTSTDELGQTWGEVAASVVKVSRAVKENKWVVAYNHQAAAVNAFLRDFSSQSDWALDPLFTLCRDLRSTADEADKELVAGGDKPLKLEDCARILNKAFTACITDRAPMRESRKWGTYYMIGLLFRTYFKLKSLNLCKNVLRAVSVSELPNLSEFPKAHQVTFRYYTGVLSFYKEEFKKAEEDLQPALAMTPKKYHKNRRLILHYLIPLKMMRGILPAKRILKEFPELNRIYGPLSTAIKTGNLRLFDDTLTTESNVLIAVGTYLAVERCRIVAMRQLFKKVFLLTGKETRISFDQFGTALRFVGVDVDAEEIECYLANMIAKWDKETKYTYIL